MKHQLYIFFGLLFSVFCFAQENGSIPSTSFPRLETKIPVKEEAKPLYSISKPFEITKFKKPSKVFDAPKIESKINLNPIKSDLDVGKIHADRLNKKFSDEFPDLYKRDQLFGVIRTRSKFVKVLCYDYAEEDGDKIRIWENELVIVPRLLLRNEKSEVILDLFQSSNRLEFEALNEGFGSPNTARFEIYDDFGKLLYSNNWELATGFRAIIIIEKES